MKTRAIINSLAALQVLLIATSCAVAPVNSNYESARSLKKNNLEVAGNFTNYSIPQLFGDGDATINNNFGFRIGYGATDKLDVKLSYERLMPKEDGFTPVNFFSFSPKYTFVENKFAIKLPVSLYSLNDEDVGVSDNTFSITPTLLGTIPVSEQFEAGMALSYQLFLEEDLDGFLGFALGFGFSSDLDQWSVRPEIGYQFMPEGIEDGYLNVGVAFTYNFDLNK